MAYYTALIAKWATLAPGSTQEKLVQLNAIKVTGPAVPMIIPTYQIYNLIDAAEWTSLSDANKQLVRDIMGMGTVDVSPNTHIRARMMAVFGVGTTTRSNLATLAATYDSPQIPWATATIAQGGGALNVWPVTINELIGAGLS